MPLAAGEKLGPYAIVAPLGAGGMGEVYRAHDARLDRHVAIKVLPEALARSPQALARFHRETKALAALSHPNLLAIFDTGDENGLTYAVTELLEGETLRGRLRRGAMPWRDAAQLAAALADGLAAAHSKGIIHRDIKPDNIFLTAAGHAKILDFGIALVESPSPDDAVTRTSEGLVVGTPGYLSPEQVRGETAVPASDLFALGCVLHEALTGKPAFRRATAMETLSAVLRDPPDAASAVNAPPEVRRLLDQCLDKSPRQRPAGARELAQALRAALQAASGSHAAPGAIDSIAVLPFSNTSQNPDSEYLAEGLTESLINALAQIPRMRVIPRSSVFRYKGTDRDPQAIGRELNVRVVLTGRVAQRGERLVVGAELMDVEAGSQLWGERYNRPVADLFELEDEIARQISGSLRLKLSPAGDARRARRHSANSDAYQAYLRGRHHWARRTPPELRKGAACFQEAIDRDPTYAAAYSGLADCYSLLGTFSILPQREALARAKASAVAAVAFDEELADGHASLGFVRAYFDFDWRAACAELTRAAELDPGYWTAPYWHSTVLCSMGRFEEAESMVARALELEPMSPPIAHVSLMNAMARRHYDAAVEMARQYVQMHPAYFLLYLWLSGVLVLMGRYREGVEAAEKAVETGGGWTHLHGTLGWAYAMAGRRDDALALRDRLIERARTEVIDYYALMILQTGLGDTAGALEAMDRACESGGLGPLLLGVDPRLDAIRSEPRAQQLLRRMNLLA